MTNVKRALQIIEFATDEHEAQVMLTGVRLQDGFIGGRILAPTRVIGKDRWRVQAFIEQDEADPTPQLDGVLSVIVWDEFLANMDDV